MRMQGTDAEEGAASPVSIRPAAPDDAGAICRIHRSSVCVLCSAAYSPQEIEAWVGHTDPAEYRKLLAAGDETFFVAERDHEVVGFSALHDDEVTAVFVDPERGRGTGEPLLAAVEDVARKKGVPMLRLLSTITGFPFYLAHGYVEQGRSSMIRSGVALLVIEMTKILLAG